jgi:hypothetical protein
MYVCMYIHTHIYNTHIHTFNMLILTGSQYDMPVIDPRITLLASPLKVSLNLYLVVNESKAPTKIRKNERRIGPKMSCARAKYL